LGNGYRHRFSSPATFTGGATMANQDKTNTNQGNTQSKQSDSGNVGSKGTQGNPADWNTQKTGQTQSGNQAGGQGGKSGGSHMGGKNPPTGGPDQYKPNEPMEGERKGADEGGNPYPPASPERPLMAESDQKAGSQSGAESAGDQTGQFGGQFGDKATVGGEEEEE
jgi:hypothetical protein